MPKRPLAGHFFGNPKRLSGNPKRSIEFCRESNTPVPCQRARCASRVRSRRANRFPASDACRSHVVEVKRVHVLRRPCACKNWWFGTRFSRGVAVCLPAQRHAFVVFRFMHILSSTSEASCIGDLPSSTSAPVRSLSRRYTLVRATVAALVVVGFCLPFSSPHDARARLPAHRLCR